MDKVDFEQASSSPRSPLRDLELLTAALNSSISGIIITDNQLRDNPIIYCNHTFEKMTGYSRHEIIGRNCRFLQMDDREQPERASLRRAVEEGRECLVEIRNYHKNGTLFWNELYIAPIKNKDGIITHFIGIQNDVSRRKKAEEDLLQQKKEMEKEIEKRTQALRDSEEYLASIVATVREGLIVLDSDMRVTGANDHFLRTFRVTKEETIGIPLWELGNRQWDIPKLRELIEDVLPTSNPVENFEVEHDFPRIGKKLMLLNAHRIELEGQYKDRILIALEDITERREIERRKDDFLSIASHELKTPLTTIHGYVQMMNRTVPADASDKFRSFLEKTGAYVSRLNDLILELLDVSKIQSGNIEIHKEPFDFDRAVHEAAEGIRAANSGYTIAVKGKTGVYFNGDESHIVQVINNLLANAIKYSPDNKDVEVILSVLSGYLKVSVTDRGLGISQEDQRKIFDRFYRAGEIQKRYPGMGIGLYICDQIIKNHGGTMWVDSEKGKGSTFNFTLPLTEQMKNEY